MNAEEAENKEETNYCELPEEVKNDLLNSPNASSNIDVEFTIGKENENEVSNTKSGSSSNSIKLTFWGITKVRHDPNNTDECRLTKVLTLNRDVKKELTHDTEHVAQKENLVETLNSARGKETCKEEHKPASSASSSTGEINIGIDESRAARFRNKLFVAIEELRIQRTLDLENEEKIKSLMTEKHELERKKEEETSKYNALVEHHAQQEIDIKKQKEIDAKKEKLRRIKTQEDRLLQYEEDKAKMTLSAECTEKELKVLKDEVRALHLVKYKLEKKIKEQDRLIQLQNSARDSHESQISALEQRSKKALDQCTQLADFVEKTDARISAASRLQRKLMYTNEHQKCLLESYKRELESKKYELVALKAAVSQKNDCSMRSTEQERSRADTLEKELQLQNEVCRRSQSQLEDARLENKKLMQSLKEAHELLDRHVQSINKHCELEAVAHLELDETKTECHTLKESLGKEQAERQRLENTLKSKTTELGDQKQALERRLEELQKEYESLSEAHNSLEQLNSTWSEQNMEQKNKTESMVKEVDELKVRLAQAEESINLHKDKKEEMKNTHSNEILSLQEKLQAAKQDYESETKRTVSLEDQNTSMRKTIEDLQQEIINKEKEQVLNKKKITDTSCQTENGFCEQISHLSDKLLRATQSCKNQTERADYLEDQCTMLKEKVNDLLFTVAQKEKEKIEKTIDSAVQTDDAPKMGTDSPPSENFSSSIDNKQVQDHGINKPLENNEARKQRHEDNTCKENERLNRVNRETSLPVSNNSKEGDREKLICGIEKLTCQFKVSADKKVVKENASDDTGDKVARNKVNEDDEKRLSSIYGNGQISQETLTKPSGITSNQAATQHTLGIASPPKMISVSIGYEESINKAKSNRGINERIAKDSSELPKSNKLPGDLESSMPANGESERGLSSCKEHGDTSVSEKESQTLAASGGTKSKTNDDQTIMPTKVSNNNSSKEKSVKKKVRFNLDENRSSETNLQNSSETQLRKRSETKLQKSLEDTARFNVEEDISSETKLQNSSDTQLQKSSEDTARFNVEEDRSSETQLQNSSDETNKEETQMMFSDEEDGDNKCRSIDEDVNQRISRIQNLLRSDRLRTNRKRKFPVV